MSKVLFGEKRRFSIVWTPLLPSGNWAQGLYFGTKAPGLASQSLQPCHKGLLWVGEGTGEERPRPQPLPRHPAQQLHPSTLKGLREISQFSIHSTRRPDIYWFLKSLGDLGLNQPISWLLKLWNSPSILVVFQGFALLESPLSTISSFFFLSHIFTLKLYFLSKFQLHNIVLSTLVTIRSWDFCLIAKGQNPVTHLSLFPPTPAPANHFSVSLSSTSFFVGSAHN